MSIKRVYLAGAINGCTDAEMSDWREATAAEAAAQAIKVMIYGGQR